MKWRNEQMYHLRQSKPLTIEDQENYFTKVVSSLFKQEEPNQILFSYLENGTCIGYGGLVHINWIDKNAEISFIMNTGLEKNHFQEHWVNYLVLIEKIAFEELNFHKIYTYAFDLRPQLYEALEKAGFAKDARLKKHCFFNGKYIDVLIHSKFMKKKALCKKDELFLRNVEINDATLIFNWANEISVRNNSINQDPIIWDNHLKWFKSKLNNSNTKILVLATKNENLGQIRIDLVGEYWIIDYSIDDQFRGNGLGKEIVKLLLSKFKSFKFKANVKKQNQASISIFTNLGFRKIQIEEIICFEY